MAQATGRDLLAYAQENILFRVDGKPRRGQDPLVRILGRCVETDGGCWEFQGVRTGCGYGHVRFNGNMRIASRVVWQLTNGEIADGLTVCHSCDNPPCCNPAHLWLGTSSDNARDREQKGRSAGNLIPGQGIAAMRAKTHCRSGRHPWTPENSDLDPQGRRRCRACRTIAAQARSERGAA